MSDEHGYGSRPLVDERSPSYEELAAIVYDEIVIRNPWMRGWDDSDGVADECRFCGAHKVTDTIHGYHCVWAMAQRAYGTPVKSCGPGEIPR